MRELAGERRIWIGYAKLCKVTRDVVAFAGQIERLKGRRTDGIAYSVQRIDQFGIHAACEISILELLIAMRRREAGLNLEYYSRADRLT